MRLSGLAARALGWTPPVFWAATPAELAACIDAQPGVAAPPDREEIAAMIERDRHG
nr:phage tail assembly chaperone [Qipengyuania pelagi]